MARSGSSRPLRTIGVLAGLVAVLYGLIGAGVLWSNAQWTPKLALDLEGGTQIVLKPVSTGAQKSATSDQINEAVRIIQRRVNGSGISEAEVTRQGTDNIIVSLPGARDQATIDLVRQSAQLQFRAVLAAAGTQPEPAASPTGSPSPSGSPSASPSGSPSPSKGSTLKPGGSPSPTTSSNGMAIPEALLAPGAARQAAEAPSPSPTGSPAASPKASTAATPQAKPTDASDPNWIDEALAKRFEALDCKDVNALRRAPNDPATPLVTCSDDGTAKYILGPAEVVGTDVTGATAGLETNQQGFTGTSWEVNLTFSGEGAKKFGDVTARLAKLQGVRNQFGIVLDNLVITAPTTNEAIPNGQARISGNFTQASAQTLAQQLKYGALPVTFEAQTEQQISATLGAEQLQRGLLAGLIGLALVVVYSLLQYRALGLVTVASLFAAAAVTYGFVVLLGWRQGYRLSLPGVAGLIVSIGITADSFIVFFERVRDEVRDGRGLQAAVEAAWVRARRTILASDAVNFLAAAVLYLLAVGGVRGFAFTLGLTTIVDVIIVFLFTKPLVALLARTRFFGSGHRLSGFDEKHLGRQVSYAGRGRLRTPQPAQAAAAVGPDVAEEAPRPVLDEPARRPAPSAPRPGGRGDGLTIAQRRAAAERAARSAVLDAEDGPATRGDDTTDDGAADGARTERSGARGRDA